MEVAGLEEEAMDGAGAGRALVGSNQLFHSGASWHKIEMESKQNCRKEGRME